MSEKVRRIGLTAAAGLFLGATLILLPASVRGASQPISYIYWDENERELFYNNPSTTPIPSQTYCNASPADPTCLVPNYASNGQMCIFPDTTGRFTTGYNPTNADQLPNPGANLPKMTPPVGEAVFDIHGNFTGKTMSVPGPYKGLWESPTDPGGDIPPDDTGSGGGATVSYGANTLTDTSASWPTNHWANVKVGTQGAYVLSNTATTLTLTANWSPQPANTSPYTLNGPFNADGTHTGCVFDSMGNLFSVDLGSSQGNFPPNDTGRLIEWYAGDNYTTPCIIYGPNAGGNVPTGTMGLHHVDGSGGLFQPGTLARDSSDNVYVPSDTFSTVTSPAPGIVPTGEVLKFNHSSFPANAAACHNGIDQTTGNNVHADEFHQATFSIFIQGTPAFLPLPAGIARDPVCKCWAVSDVIGSPAIAYFDDTGTPMARAVPTGSGPAGNPNFNPYGIAVDPMGNLFAVDIHLTQGCNTDVPNSCVGINIGPQANAGQALEWMFASALATAPTPPAATLIGNGYNFPVSITSCNPQIQTCPTPAPAVVFPESPWVPGLLLAGAGLGYLAWRRQRGSTER